YSKKGSPFFLYIAYNAPHSPLQAKKNDLLSYGFDENKPLFGKKTDNQQGRGNTKRQTYSAMVSNMDANIGRILQLLNTLEIDDNTLVWFQSDNGAAPGEGGSSGQLKGTKFTEWEGGVRAPAIVRWPKGFEGGYVNNQVMGYIDVMPTLLAVAGVKSLPKKPFDGLSMVSVLADQTKKIDRNLFLGAGAIVNQEWKLIEGPSVNPRMRIQDDQLFHITNDLSEKWN